MDRRLYRKPMSFWKKRKVRANRDIKNRGGDIIPAGTECRVTHKYGRFYIDGDNGVSISRVNPESVDLIDEKVK